VAVSSKRSRRAALAVLLILLALAGALVFHRRASEPAISDLEAAAQVHETVQVGGTTVHVANGIVQGSVPAYLARRATGLAYLKAAAERDPIAALPGEDLASFGTAVDDLAGTEATLVAAQTSAADAAAVRSLYPIDFLRAIGSAEAARRAFIATGSDTDEAAYDRSLHQALVQYRIDLNNFSNAEARALSGEERTYAVADALVSGDTISAAVSSLAAADTAALHELERREQCAADDSASCIAADLAYPDLSVPSSPISQDAFERSRSVRSILAQATSDPSIAAASTTVYSIPDSVCADAPGSPLFILYSEHIESGTVRTPLLVSDMRFLPTTEQDPYVQYFGNFQYFWYPSLTHYKCAQIQADTSLVAAIAAAAALGKDDPLSRRTASTTAIAALSHDEAALAGMLVTESAAAAYAADALHYADSLDAAGLTAAQELYLRFALRAGALAPTIEKIAFIERANAALASSVPTDVQARRLFLSESGFVALFLGDNRSFYGSTQPLLPPDTMPLSEQPYVYFSQLPRSADLSNLEQSIAAFYALYR